jgi:hypothetical protein
MTSFELAEKKTQYPIKCGFNFFSIPLQKEVHKKEEKCKKKKVFFLV